MKRVKETILYLLLFAALGICYMKLSNQYLTAEQVFKANEIGLRYGPSEKILLQQKNGRDALIIGKVDDRALSVVPVSRSLLGLWTLRGGGVAGYTPIMDAEHGKAQYARDFHLVYGLTDVPETATVTCKLQYKNNELPDFVVVQTMELPVDGDGFFAATCDDGKPKEDEGWYYISDVEGRDADGTLLWQAMMWS